MAGALQKPGRGLSLSLCLLIQESTYTVLSLLRGVHTLTITSTRASTQQHHTVTSTAAQHAQHDDDHARRRVA